jgi:hypothetical protein
VFDGSIPIVTMELQFKETTKLTRVDMEGATFTEDRNSTILKVKTASGGFIADPDAKFIGEVSY